MPNSKTSEASHVSKARRVTLKKYKIKNWKTQEKTQNSIKKLKTQAKNSKNSAFFRPLHAEKMAKKPACFIIPPLALFRTCLCVKTPIRLDSELIIEDNYRFSNWSCVLRKKNSPRHLEDPDREMDISARQLSKFDTFGFCSVVLIFKATSTSLREKKTVAGCWRQ